jgi:hypothetical protein
LPRCSISRCRPPQLMSWAGSLQGCGE